MMNEKKSGRTHISKNNEPGKIRFGCTHMALIIHWEDENFSIKCDNPKQGEEDGENIMLCKRVITGECNFIDAGTTEPLKGE
jgi:hypothetical protein